MRGRVGRGFWMVVVGEVIALLVGALVLTGPLNASDAVIVWVSVVVGVHFIALAAVWHQPFYDTLGVAITICGVAALVAAAAGASTAVIAVIGGVSPGFLLLGSAYRPILRRTRALDAFVTWPRPHCVSPKCRPVHRRSQRARTADRARRLAEPPPSKAAHYRVAVPGEARSGRPAVRAGSATSARHSSSGPLRSVPNAPLPRILPRNFAARAGMSQHTADSTPLVSRHNSTRQHGATPLGSDLIPRCRVRDPGGPPVTHVLRPAMPPWWGASWWMRIVSGRSPSPGSHWCR